MDATKSSRSFRSEMLRSVMTLRKRTMKDVKGHNMMDLEDVSKAVYKKEFRLTYQVIYSSLNSEPMNSAFLLQL